MKEVYLIYASIPSTLFDCKLHDFVHDSTKYSLKNMYYTGLYAWTTKKELLEEFLEFRQGAKSIYKVIKREFEKDDYQEFKLDNEYEELNYYKKYNNRDDFRTDSINSTLANIICTKAEYENAYDIGAQYLFDYMSRIISAEYLVLKDEYKLSLDHVGYCDMFNRLHDGIDDNDEYNEFYYNRYEFTNYNEGFGLSFYGQPLIDICKNNLLIFINIYYEMIVGFDPNTEIKLLIYR